MIIHPDGRKEGKPEELAAYERLMQQHMQQMNPVVTPQPSIPTWTTWPYGTEITCGSVTYTGPEITSWN